MVVLHLLGYGTSCKWDLTEGSMPVRDALSPSLSSPTSLPPDGLTYENRQPWLALSGQYAFLSMIDYTLLIIAVHQNEHFLP